MKRESIELTEPSDSAPATSPQAAPSRDARRSGSPLHGNEEKRYRFFPGWTMLGVAAAAQFMSAPGQSYSVATFKEPMLAGLRISETNYSLAYGMATILSGVMLPFLGRLVDRIGARRVLPTIALLLGGACFCMAKADGLGGIYLGFALIRPLGQGALTLLSTWLVGEWFEVRRGFATAVAGLGGSLSVMTIPLVNNWLITHYGWQAAWIALGCLVWGVLVLPSLFLVRDRPEDLGLQPDGLDALPLHPTPEDPSPSVESWTVAHILRDVTFWKLLAVPATSGMVGTGLIFHQVSLLGSRGVSDAWAISLISLQAVVAALASLGVGWLTDRLPNRYLLATAMLMLAVSVALVLVLPSPEFALVYAIVLGLHGSVLRSTGMVVWLNYYGRAHQGAVRGVAFSVMILAAAVGPMPFALSADQLGSYDLALAAFIVIPLVSALLVSTAHPPKRPPTSVDTA